MRDLHTYISESCFAGGDFYKHSYANDVIDQIINTGTIRLGANGEKTHSIPDDIRPALGKELSDKKTSMTREEFDEIMKSHGQPTWNKIFKGDFSGYKNGLASKNRGNEFEDRFIDEFSTRYAQELQDALKLPPYTFENCIPTSEGGKNQARPLTVDGKDIVVGGNHSTVGESVVDVFVKDVNGNPYNLSLKWGPTVTFINAGISRIFTKRSFEQYSLKGDEYKADTFNGIDGNKLLDLFCIDHNKFGDIWASDKKERGERVDVTKELRQSKEFTKFVESAIGYNYVLVHELNRKVHYVDLRTEADMRKLLAGGVRKAEVCYRGLTGTGTRIDIVVDFNRVQLKFNIRDKQSTPGHYPTHIMCDYVIKH